MATGNTTQHSNSCSYQPSQVADDDEKSLYTLFSPYLLTTPIELGLGHSVSQIGQLHPVAPHLGTALDIKLGIILKDTGLVDISLVVGSLLLIGLGTDLFVLGLGEAGWDVGSVGESAGLHGLLGTGAVVVRVGDGGPEIHVGNLLEEGFVELGGGGGGGGRDKGRGGGHGGSEEESGGLHGSIGGSRILLLDGIVAFYAGLLCRWLLHACGEMRCTGRQGASSVRLCWLQREARREKEEGRRRLKWKIAW